MSRSFTITTVLNIGYDQLFVYVLYHDCDHYSWLIFFFMFSSSHDPKAQLTRRSFVLVGMKGALTGVLLGRLYWLQVESNDHYKTLSDKNRIHSDVIPPMRGQLMDQRDIVLAGNTFGYRALLQRDHTKEWIETLETM